VEVDEPGAVADVAERRRRLDLGRELALCVRELARESLLPPARARRDAAMPPP
jgi:hypothetical protein